MSESETLRRLLKKSEDDSYDVVYLETLGRLVKMADGADLETYLDGKQDKLNGIEGQVVGFNADGKAVALEGVTMEQMEAVIRPALEVIGSLGAPSRTVEVTAAELLNYINNLPRLLTEHLTIKVTGTATLDYLDVIGLYGSGSLTIQVDADAEVIVQVRSRVDFCSVPVIMDGIKIIGNNSLAGSVLVSSHGSFLTARNCMIDREHDATKSAAVAISGSRLCLEQCQFTHCGPAFNCQENSILYAVDCTGENNSFGVYAYGGIVMLRGTSQDLVSSINLSKAGGLIIGNDGKLLGEAENSIGRSMAGQTVEPVQDAPVVAAEGAEVFNDYRPRDFAPSDTSLKALGNIASGKFSHAEGIGTTASGTYSHAEGACTVASAYYDHAEGYITIASGGGSHAEGASTKAQGLAAHAEGYATQAGAYSHAEGNSTVASGNTSHAAGYKTTAKGYVSYAGGLGTVAASYGQFVIGRYNIETTKDISITDFDAMFIIGRGEASDKRANAFRVAHNAVYGGTYSSSGADYAEFFEWLDSNPNNEDRAGLFVTLEGERLRLANPEDDFILGIVSADPSVVGDVYDDQWVGMYMRDIFGRTIMEMQDFPAETTQVPREDGTTETVELIPTRRELAPKINPEYDPTTKYLPRSQRPEWDAVGMMGKLVAVDDGTCQVNGWCTVGEGGKATHSDARTRYRVMARLDETHIRVLIL